MKERGDEENRNVAEKKRRRRSERGKKVLEMRERTRKINKRERQLDKERGEKRLKVKRSQEKRRQPTAPIAWRRLLSLTFSYCSLKMCDVREARHIFSMWLVDTDAESDLNAAVKRRCIKKRF